MNHSQDAFATWCMSTSHLCRQFGGFVSLLDCCGNSPRSKHPCTLTATVRSTPSLQHQRQLYTALCGCSRSDADPSTGPWDSLLSPHPGSPSLRGSDPLCSTSLTAWNSCAGQDSVRGGRWAGHEPQDFCILISAAGRISEWPCIQLSLPTHRLCCVTLSDPVTGEAFVEPG